MNSERNLDYRRCLPHNRVSAHTERKSRLRLNEVIEITIFDRLCNTGKVAAVEGSSVINVRYNLTALVKTSVV